MKKYNLSLENVLATAIVLVLFYGIINDSESIFRVVFPIAAMLAWVLAFVHLYRYSRPARNGKETKVSTMVMCFLFAVGFSVGAAYYLFFI